MDFTDLQSCNAPNQRAYCKNLRPVWHWSLLQAAFIVARFSCLSQTVDYAIGPLRAELRFRNFGVCAAISTIEIETGR
jgi:hypothetical protein